MEILNSIDDLKLYRGQDYPINGSITIHQPSLGEICDYGEKEYYSMVSTLCSVGADMKWQLDDIGIDYTTVEDFDLFCTFLTKGMTQDRTRILFGDILDFSQMENWYNKKLQENVLIQQFDSNNYIQIDRYVYNSVMGVIRKIHRLKRNNELPGNEATKQVLIEDAREEYELSKNQPRKPFLLPLISAMVNSEGFKHDELTVFDMKIYPFMDSVARISKIKNADLLMASGYSGFGVDLKKIDKDILNWTGELK